MLQSSVLSESIVAIIVDMEDLTAANLLQRSLVALLKYLPVKKLAKSDEVARTELFSLVSDLLDYTDHEISVESKGRFCALCEQYIRSNSDCIQLNCSPDCYCCGLDCLQRVIDEQRRPGWHLIYDAKCGRCENTLPRSAVYTFYDPEQIARLADQSFQEEKMLGCNICGGEYAASNMITLPCNHRFCKDDMTGYLDQLIGSGQVVPEKTICPQKNCGTEIEEAIIFSLVDRQSIDIIQRLRLVATMESMKNEDQKVL